MTPSLLNPNAPFESFQKRLRSGELYTPELNDQNRRLFGLPSQMVVREAFIADREAIRDSFQGGLSYDRTFVGYQR